MTVNKISNINNTQTAPVQAVPQKAAQTNIQRISQHGSGISPLSSRYTYAIGRDGKRYVLQLRIDISSVKAFSSMA